jgi:S-adenosylmethionine decarboxylase
MNAPGLQEPAATRASAAPSSRITLGAHVLADLHGIDPGLLRDADGLRFLLTEAARVAHANVLGAHFHTFGDTAGVTGVVLLSESHITIHTWPEHSYAALDIFMCGQARPEQALEHIRQALAPNRADTTHVPRGARGISASAY